MFVRKIYDVPYSATILEKVAAKDQYDAAVSQGIAAGYVTIRYYSVSFTFLEGKQLLRSNKQLVLVEPSLLRFFDKRLFAARTVMTSWSCPSTRNRRL